jgi:hypothetical protein
VLPLQQLRVLVLLVLVLLLAPRQQGLLQL